MRQNSRRIKPETEASDCMVQMVFVVCVTLIEIDHAFVLQEKIREELGHLQNDPDDAESSESDCSGGFWPDLNVIDDSSSDGGRTLALGESCEEDKIDPETCVRHANAGSPLVRMDDPDLELPEEEAMEEDACVSEDGNDAELGKREPTDTEQACVRCGRDRTTCMCYCETCMHVS